LCVFLKLFLFNTKSLSLRDVRFVRALRYAGLLNLLTLFVLGEGISLLIT